ncbi:MAG: UDP-N-acetylmuramoyl-tripeptide--D-alanyl-D-alanine ligase [Paracoccaceae bacterium]
MKLWTGSEAAEATGGVTKGDWTASGVSIDTRTLQPGDLFVALKADRDGHDFVAQALEKGAAAALVSHVPDSVPENSPLLIVPDVLDGLVALGSSARTRTKARVIAVTGSVGKTSTKEMLRAILRLQGKTHAAEASYNNHWGVPLTLARMPKDTDYAVIEVGMNHPGEISPLAQLARPDVVLITTVAAAHLEAFENVDEIAQEKAAIMDGLRDGGSAILNADIDQSAILRAKAKDVGAQIVDFGEKAKDFRLDQVTLNNDTTVVQASAFGEPLLFKINTPGRHFAMNGLGALAAADALGADVALSVQGLGQWFPYKGRGVRETLVLDPVETDQTLDLLDDSYNANPTSLAAALEVLAVATVLDDLGRVTKGRRIAVLGDMKELGANEAAMHCAVADLPAMKTIDVVHCIGPLMNHLFEALPESKRGVWMKTSEAFVEAGVRRHLDSGDVVLAKGSLSMKLGLIVDAIRKMGHASAQEITQDDG